METGLYKESLQKLKYHHIGIPTDIELPKEDYLPKYKLTASGYFDNPYGIEWLNFDEDCEMPELVKTVPHVAFVVENLEEAIKDKKILIAPDSPSEGVKVAFIEEDGAP